MSHGQAASEKLPDNFAVSLTNQQSLHAVDEQQLVDAARLILAESEFTSATVSLAVVGDVTIHELNRRFLEHDWPTDVLSFVLDERDGHLEGEVILSADTAEAEAAEIGWPAAAEQLLYVIHGMLHLVGYRDKTAEDALAMRAAEDRYLHHFGIDQPHPSRSTEAVDESILAADGEGGQAAS